MIAQKTLSFALIGLILNLCFLQVTAFGNPKEERHTAKVKSGIMKMGIGKDSKVVVKLKDKTKIKGYISDISESGFTIVEIETNLEKNVSFHQVKQVKGNNLSKGVKIAIGVGVVIAIIAVLAYFSLPKDER